MRSFKNYKKIYKDATFKSYIFNHVLYKPKRWLRIPYCVYMCIKYPFLYPRNRFTGLHYNNWKILNFLNNIRQKYCYYKMNPSKEEIYILKIDLFYIESISPSFIQGWTNWWAKPLHKIIKFYHDYILQLFHCLPTYTEWDAVDSGWNQAFGKQYLNELKQQLIKDKMLYSFRITDIKEKWGRFQLYCTHGSQKIYEIINKYEELSWHTCIKCGKEAIYTTKGWISPYCEECANKIGMDKCAKIESKDYY